MDRRSFVRSALLSAGFLALSAGVADALPGASPHAALANAANDEIETVWWRRRRRVYRRRWRRWHRW